MKLSLQGRRKVMNRKKNFLGIAQCEQKKTETETMGCNCTKLYARMPPKEKKVHVT